MVNWKIMHVFPRSAFGDADTSMGNNVRRMHASHGSQLRYVDFSIDGKYRSRGSSCPFCNYALDFFFLSPSSTAICPIFRRVTILIMLLFLLTSNASHVPAVRLIYDACENFAK